MPFWVKVCIGVVVVIGGLVLFGWMRLQSLRRRRERAMAEFRILAEPLCVKFRQAAEATGKPRGLRWKQCDYDGDEMFAVDRKNGSLYALAKVLISFEAIPGGPMEDAEAAGDVRAATAVFVLRDGEWTTEGRVLFNVSPEQAIERFEGTLAPWLSAGAEKPVA